LDVSKKEWEFYEQGFNDLCIIKAGSQEFKIDKKKLMASSSVLERMLKSGSKDAQAGIIRMENTSPKAVQSLIKFLHVHTLESPNEFISELYELADEYEIVDLKEKCSQILLGELHEDNVYERLVLSFKHEDEEFKGNILGYLKSNPAQFKGIIRSDAWANLILNDKQLAEEISDEVFKTLGLC